LSILDKCTMAASIEGRVPYLDHKLIQYTFKNDNVGNNSENYQNSKKFLRRLLNQSKISYISDRNKLGFNMPISNIIANQDNIEHIKSTLIATKPILEKHIDYPLMYKMVTDNKYENAENIASIYVLSKWIKNREKECCL
jgi:asparagine synthetase B (glutamine-hydrolysing)